MQDNHSQKANSTPKDEFYWSALIEQAEFESVETSSEPEQVSYGVNGFRILDSPIQDCWELAQTAQEEDKVFELNVTGYNKGGLIVYWHDIQGFVPASQLVGTPVHSEKRRLDALRNRQDETLKLKLIEVTPTAKRLIFSERAALTNAEQRAHLWQTIRPGLTLEGTITNLTKFGAFVDLGGIEGLIHISQLSWRRLFHPSDIVEPGQRIKVAVMEVDRAQERVALSRKHLVPDPWLTVEERYRPEQIVSGVVSNITNYGVFALLEEGLEGLLHSSELGDGPTLHPGNIVEKGDKITARVLRVSSQERRLSLSLRGVPNPITKAN